MVFLILLGAFSFAGLGLLVASRAKTIEAVSGLMNLVMLPMWVLSGIFFSSERFPELLQPFIQALPLTALIDALRAVMLEGATLASQWARGADPGAVGRGVVRAGAAVLPVELRERDHSPRLSLGGWRIVRIADGQAKTMPIWTSCRRQCSDSEKTTGGVEVLGASSSSVPFTFTPPVLDK